VEIQLLSEKEVAEQLRVKPCTVRNERVRGRLGFVRIGARIFYLPEQVEEYVERQKVSTRADQTEGKVP
jgi:NADH/NAD ratio-sensing transcriptional regulator Rex